MSAVRSVLFVISKFAPGGAERVLAVLANEWRRREVRVTVLTLKDAELYFPLSDGIEVIKLGLTGASPTPLHALLSNRKRVAAVRKVIDDVRPDAVISFMTMTNIVTILAAKGAGVPVYAAERNHPERYEVSRIWKWLRNRVYRRRGRLVVQTEGIAAYYRRRRIPVAAVIPNPVNPDFFAIKHPQGAADSRAARPAARTLLAVGRLNRQKGFDLLLRAFAAAGLDGWRLRIVGEGKQRGQLEALAGELGIAGLVELPGATADIAAEYAGADAFVLSSRFEGFPNVLLEAMAGGLPCIAFDCPTGPAELLQHGQSGLLVPAENIEELSVAIRRLAGDEELRRSLSTAARRSAEEYRPEKIIAQWEKLVF